MQGLTGTSKLIGLAGSLLLLAMVAGGCSSGNPTPEQNAINAANQADQAASRADAAAQRAQAAASQAQSAASRTEQAANDAKASAAAAATKATADLTAATTFQQSYGQTVTDMTNKVKPSKVNVGASSPGITLKVADAPITVALTQPAANGQVASKLEVPVTIARRPRRSHQACRRARFSSAHCGHSRWYSGCTLWYGDLQV